LALTLTSKEVQKRANELGAAFTELGLSGASAAGSALVLRSMTPGWRKVGIVASLGGGVALAAFAKNRMLKSIGTGLVGGGFLTMVMK